MPLANLLQKRLQHRRLLVNFAKFQRIPFSTFFSEKTFTQLLPNINSKILEILKYAEIGHLFIIMPFYNHSSDFFTNQWK